MGPVRALAIMKTRVDIAISESVSTISQKAFDECGFERENARGKVIAKVF